jgi:hypothetical protein
MQLDLEALRQHYDRLTDEALLEVARDDLTDMARDVYDAEISKRGIDLSPEESSTDEPSAPAQESGEFEVVAEFNDAGEAQLANSALRSAGIASQLESKVVRLVQGSIKILVPREDLETALEILAAPVSEDDLVAQAEAAGREAMMPIGDVSIDPTGAQAALEAGEIPCYVENGRIFVPPDLRFRARQILAAIMNQDSDSDSSSPASNGGG